MPPRLGAQLKMLLVGPAIIIVGVMVTKMGYEMPDSRSFLWPYDGIIAVVGGLGVLAWFLLRGFRAN